MSRNRPSSLSWLQPGVLVGCFVPFVVIAARAVTGGLGANPIATALNQLGLLALLLLVATLCCTPLRLVFGWGWPMRLRRTLGVMSFVAALSHFSVYVVLDRGLAWREIGADLGKRPFIVVGFAALVLLTPLAATSTRGAVRALGAKRWRALHRLAYVCAALGVAHFFYRVKADLTEPLVYGVVLATLFGVRVVSATRRRRAAA